LVNQPSSRQGAFGITRPPPLRFGEPRRSRKSKETLSEARQRPPRSSRQAGRPAAGKANLRDAGRSWGAADDDGFPAREEREQTEDDRARVPLEQDAGGCAFGSDSAVKSCGLWGRLVGLHRRHHRGWRARRDRQGLPGRNHSLDRTTLIARACRQFGVWNNWRGQKLNGRTAEQ
jgi:hypothetical protein